MNVTIALDPLSMVPAGRLTCFGHSALVSYRALEPLSLYLPTPQLVLWGGLELLDVINLTVPISRPSSTLSVVS